MLMVREGCLEAPEEYWMMSELAKGNVCNSAGPKGYGWLVPDTLYGLDCTPCFDIHDYCYHVWKDSNGKDNADRLMLDNLYRFIDDRTKKGWYMGWLRFLRRRRALKYYLAVSLCGSAFYN